MSEPDTAILHSELISRRPSESTDWAIFYQRTCVQSREYISTARLFFFLQHFYSHLAFG